MRHFALMTALFALSACGGTEPDDTDQITDPLLEPGQVEVAHYRLPCEGEGRALCLQVRAFGEPDFSLFSGEIEGFDFTWGEHSILQVRTEPIADPPADGSDRRFLLEAVIDTDVVRDAFDLPIEAEDVAVLGPTTLRLLDGTEAACASEDLCRVITARMGDGPVTVRARAGANPGEPLSFFRLM